MSIRVLGVAAGISVLLPFAAIAADTAANAPQTTSTPQQANPVVCHYYYYEGSVISRPDCRTQHQWERRRYAEQRFFREFQMKNLEQQQ